MAKKVFRIIIAILLLCVVVISLLFFGNPVSEFLVRKNTKQHLAEKYKDTDSVSREEIIECFSDVEELRANGIKLRDRDAVKAYFAEKQRLADEAAAAEAAALAEAARLDREANPTTEDLLKLILAELKNK